MIFLDFNSSKVINNQEWQRQHVCEKCKLCEENPLNEKLQLTNVTDSPSPMTAPNLQTKNASKIW